MTCIKKFISFTLIAGCIVGTAPLFAGPTAAEQQAMTPKGVLEDLMAGNERFVSGFGTQRNLLAEAAATASGQYPKAAIVSCLDSRVPVEMVFDQGIGDIFVGRVAGNIEDEAMLGSLEFATAAAGVKLVMVLGHEACGAVKGAIDDVKLGNLTALLAEIQPAIGDVKSSSGPRTSKNAAFVDDVVHANVKRTMADMRARSEVLSNLEKEGKIMIVGAYYSLEDGKVTLVN